MYCRQSNKNRQDSISTNGSGQLVTDETDKDVPMNIMYADAVFKALPTTWLYMKYSDDDGKTWSDPILLNGMVKAEDSRVLVTGPRKACRLKTENIRAVDRTGL